ncbi:MAG: hypothetical protein ACJ8GN_07865 [Longimicrobiaceae bacterium]
MSRKLVIKFRCLCFFVYDPEKGQMHVVAPATCGCENGGGGSVIDRHGAFLVFPKAGGRLNATGNFKQDDEEGKVDFVEMEGWAMTLGNGTAALDFQSLVDLNDVTGGAVHPALVRGPRDRRISSRITLQGGRMTTTLTPGTWNFDGEEVKMARDVTWTIDDIPGDTLVVRRSRFVVGEQPNPEGDEEVVELQPNQRDEFRLEFHHSMVGDFGRPLETRDPDRAAGHFAAYYTLYDQPAKKPIPKFVTSPDIGVLGCLDAKGTVGTGP